jgi:hypothetical protein
MRIKNVNVGPWDGIPNTAFFANFILKANSKGVIDIIWLNIIKFGL